MSKSTCKSCGKAYYLKGKEYWTIKEAIKNLMKQHERHKCKNSSKDYDFEE